MQYRALGKSSLSVSEVSFGCMSLGNQVSEVDIRCIQAAFDAGINFFDTADFYGLGTNEELVGKAIAPFRKDIILSSKVGNRWGLNPFEKFWDVSKSYILSAIDDTLARLRTDYLDLYQIHGGTIDDNFDEVIDTLEFLVACGKIRYYGISSIRPNVFSHYAQQTNISSNMMQYSLLDTRPNAYLDMFNKQKVSIIARGALAQGMLVDKPAGSYLGYSQEQVLAIMTQVAQLAKRYEVAHETIALQYVLQQPAVATALIGIRTEAQLLALIKAYQDINVVPAFEIDRIQLTPIQYTEHLV